MDKSEYGAFVEMLDGYQKLLARLELQAEKLGAQTPISIHNEIDETKKKIEMILQTIQNAGVNDTGGREHKQPRIHGRITFSNGKPLPKADVDLRGPARSGQMLTYTAETNLNGAYQVDVVPGMYTVRAQYSPSINGRGWTFPLHPADDSMAQVDPTAGVAKDFIWRLQGTQMGGDPGNAYDRYGGFIFVTVEYKSWQTRDPFDSAQLEFSLIPLGKLVDGSDGQPILIRRTGKQIKTPHGLSDSRDVLNTRYLADIPIGQYRLTVKRLGTFGGTLLPIALAESREDLRKSLDIDFVPTETHTGKVNINIMGV